MYKLIVVLAALVAVAFAEPGYYAASPVGVPVGTSYLNHFRDPVVSTYSSGPVYAAQPAALTFGSIPSAYNAVPYPYVSGGYYH